MSATHPLFLYGTAWKEERTEDLCFQALVAGFIGIDTANQRKHYYEEAVGRGFQKFLNQTGRKRAEFFLQTKFTFARGQDHRKPYDEQAPYGEQVVQSFASSLKHLGTGYLDSYLLHGPFQGSGLTAPDFEVWEAMEELFEKKMARQLGVSNFSLEQLTALVGNSRVKPSFVQNRCYAIRGWDREIREFCLMNKIIYQGFSLLTANVVQLSAAPVVEIARKYKKTIPQIAFRFAHQVGMLPITGTSNLQHMRENLAVFDFTLEKSELQTLEGISESPHELLT